MAKRYDPIMCMLVDEPTKAQDELSLAQKKQVVIELKGFLKKSYNFSDESEYARAYEDLRHMFTTGSRKSISGLFENTVKKTGAQDAGFVLRHKNGQYMSSAGRTNEKAKAKVFSSKREAEAYKGDYVVSSTDPDYHNWSVVAVDSASALDKAIKTCDAEGEKWITMRGSHVKIDGEGNAVAGNAKVKNIINNGKAGSSKESSGSAREKLSKMSRSDLNHFAEMYGDYDDAESFRKEDIIEDMIEEHGEEKVGKMLNTFNEMFSKGKEKKKENPVVAKKKNESSSSNASAREKLSGMSRSDLEHFAEMYGGYEDARGVRKDDIIDDMIDDYGEEKVNKMLETYNGIFKRR